MSCPRCGCVTIEGDTTCPLCGQLFGQQPAAAQAAETSSSTIEILPAESEQPQQEAPSPAHQPAVQYGGFWIRFGALMLDGVIVGLVSALIYVLVMVVAGLGIEEASKALMIPKLVADTFVNAFYFIFFHATTGQTLGKKALGLKVVRENGELLGWGKAVIRYLGTFVSGIALALGYIWVAFDDRKQSWHDKMAGSLVVRV